ncbi:DUF4376 domain-containing protein [Leptospira sp. GIMC2001]|uniref:DUF4376 domain-containing protein n=1 Tax=Leptospira sp. GIMC2001 TaxID=1513297 RepID=UPI0023497ED0|nr:hypothetical protein [Leptospira sp. GIMC2001]WCL51433.1 hypothetical protein O4O04_20165 [Leptospira sp. GIMC2001]
MNYILEKSTNIVLFYNSSKKQLSGKDAWALFKPDLHKVVFSLDYNSDVGKVFKASISNGIAHEFIKKTVYLKVNHLGSRELISWEDEIDESTETTDIPLTDEPFQKHVQGQGWQVDLVKKKEFLHNKVNFICSQKIVSGFTSSALGSVHTYDSDRDDQLNLIGSVSQGTDVYYMCKNSENPPVPDYRQHTAQQIKQVLADGAQRKLFLLQRANTLKLEIASAQTNTQLIAINIDGGWQ